MASRNKSLTAKEKFHFANAKDYLIGVVVSEYHSDICNKLRDAALSRLKASGVPENQIAVAYAPGAYEIPLAARWLFDSDDFDAVICLGCVIKGDTEHDFYINDAIAKQLMAMSMSDDAPYVFGVLTVNNYQQAEERAGGKYGNKGDECALAALKMLNLRDSLNA